MDEENEFAVSNDYVMKNDFDEDSVLEQQELQDFSDDVIFDDNDVAYL